MSKLEQLINELCPNGVEFKKIKNSYTRIKGTPITAGKMKEIASDDGEIKIFAGGKTVITAHEADIPNANITRVPAVLVQSRGVIDAVYYDKPFTFKNEMWAYTADNPIKVKYLYYVLKNNIEHFREAASGMGSLPQISLRVTEDFIIPLPPLPVQEEIVRILDKFTELTAELTAELIARNQQYEYYRDVILTSGDNIKLVPLGNIGRVAMCKRIMKNQTTSTGNIPFYKIGTFGKKPDAFISKELFNEYKEKYSFPTTGSILISASGTIGRTVVYDGNPAYYQDSNIVWLEHDESTVLNKYLYYCYQLKPWNVSDGGTISRLYNDNILKAKIPVPYPEDKERSLVEQQRMVDILDRFDKLCNDISEGLPAEIEARQKQYEYYRDKLLTFKKKEASENE